MMQQSERKSQYDGMYVRKFDDSTYWAVDGGYRRGVANPEEMFRIGQRLVLTISKAKLEEIPIEGEDKIKIRDEITAWDAASDEAFLEFERSLDSRSLGPDNEWEKCKENSKEDSDEDGYVLCGERKK